MYHYAGNNPVKYTDPDGRETSYTLTENGKTFLKKCEGSVKNSDGLLIAYNDSNNHATKGYGIKIHNGPLTPTDLQTSLPQTEADATSEFLDKVAEYENIVNNRASYTTDADGKLVTDELTFSNTESDALISLTYNSPETGKEVMKAIRNGKSETEIKNIWVGNTSGGVKKRREAEWNLYKNGVYTDDPYQ